MELVVILSTGETIVVAAAVELVVAAAPDKEINPVAANQGIVPPVAPQGIAFVAGVERIVLSIDVLDVPDRHGRLPYVRLEGALSPIRAGCITTEREPL